MIDPLIDLITEYNMTIALPPDIPAYKTTTSNWTRPDNVWRNNTTHDPITICDVKPEIRPPQADHLPIYTELDLPTQRSNAPEKRNIRDADFKLINEILQTRLAEKCPAKEIHSKEELEDTVNTFIETIQEVLNHNVPVTKPCPYTKRWWNKELTELKKKKNKLSKLSYRLRGIHDHPVHAECKAAERKLSVRIDEVKKKHWEDWLEDATPNDIYLANKYINSKPTDYSNAQIPALKSRNPDTQQEATVSDNATKAKILAETFFPPPPESPIIPDTIYPKPLKAKGIFSRNDIRKAVKKLKPFKAPGVDGIHNVVLQECIDTIIDNLYYIFRAILIHKSYPTRWLTLLTVVLRKAGKIAYNVAKAYRPIGLLDTIGKLFSSLIAEDLSFLVEKHNLLPPTQFGGRPGRCTTDAMHLLAQRIKDSWRNKQVTSILFLDIQAAFPNTVKERLLHNLKTRRVPTIYIELLEHMLFRPSDTTSFRRPPL
jgi:hypothetical protein